MTVKHRATQLGIIIALVAVGVIAVVAFSGHLSSLIAFVPFVLILACPLSMVWMMSRMGGHTMNEQATVHTRDTTPPPSSTTSWGHQSSDDHLVQLHQLLETSHQQEETIRQAIARIERDRAAATGKVSASQS